MMKIINDLPYKSLDGSDTPKDGSDTPNFTPTHKEREIIKNFLSKLENMANLPPGISIGRTSKGEYCWNGIYLSQNKTGNTILINEKKQILCDTSPTSKMEEVDDDSDDELRSGPGF